MKIHYFQRYHSKENVDTGNTLLLLSRLYSYSPDKFFKFLLGTLLPDDAEPELTFVLQDKMKKSVPDATLSQKSYKIVVETKLNNAFDVKQLINHLNSFEDEYYMVIVTLDPEPMNKNTKEKFEKELNDYNKANVTNIIHKNVTFLSLIEAIKSVITEMDTEFIHILEDYEEYCFSENLIKNDWKWMRAITAGTTFEINMQLNLYYDDDLRNYSNHQYIGLYTEKAIKAIGKITNIVTADFPNGQLNILSEKRETKDIEKAHIIEAINDSIKYGYNLEKSHTYFIVEKFYPTSYKKVSPYPIQKSKFFDLAQIFEAKNVLPNIEKMAQDLSTMTWK